MRKTKVLYAALAIGGAVLGTYLRLHLLPEAVLTVPQGMAKAEPDWVDTSVEDKKPDSSAGLSSQKDISDATLASIEAELSKGGKLSKEASESIKAILPRLAALKPKKARSLLEQLVKMSPKLAGEVYVSSRLPFEEVTILAVDLSTGAKKTFFDSLGEVVLRGSPNLLAAFYDQVPVDALPSGSVQKYVAKGLWQNPAAVRLWLEPLGSKASEVMDEFSLGASSDPADIINYLNVRIPMGGFDDNGYTAVGAVLSLAETDFLLAEEYLQKLPHGVIQKGREKMYSWELSQRALKGVEDFSAQLAATPPDLRQVSLEAVAARAGFADSIDVVAIANQLGPEEKAVFASKLLSQAAQGYSKVPLSTLSALADEIVGTEYKSSLAETVAGLAKSFAKEDPTSSLAYIRWFPPGEERMKALAPVVEAWAELEPAKACDWVEKMPASPERDLAISTIVKANPSELETVLQSTHAIKDKGVRLATIEELARLWKKADPARFQAALLSCNISEGLGGKLNGLTK